MLRRVVGCLLLGIVTTYVVAWLIALRLNVEAFGPFSSGPCTLGSRPRDAGQGEGQGTFVVWRVEAFGSTAWTSLTTGTPYERPVNDEPPLMFHFDEQPVEAVAGRMGDWLVPRRWPADGTDQLRPVWARGWPFLAVRCHFDELAYLKAREPDYTSSGKSLSAPSDDQMPVQGGFATTYEWFGWMPRFARRALVGYDNPIVPFTPIWRGLGADVMIYAGLWWMLVFAPFALRRHLRLRRNHCPHCNYDLSATPPDAPCPECGRMKSKSR